MVGPAIVGCPVPPVGCTGPPLPTAAASQPQDIASEGEADEQTTPTGANTHGPGNTQPGACPLLVCRLADRPGCTPTAARAQEQRPMPWDAHLRCTVEECPPLGDTVLTTTALACHVALPQLFCLVHMGPPYLLWLAQDCSTGPCPRLHLGLLLWLFVAPSSRVSSLNSRPDSIWWMEASKPRTARAACG